MACRCFFFLTTSSNIAVTFPTNTDRAGCLEAERKQRAENFLLKFPTDLFPGLTSRVSLFNVNVLNH